MRIKRYTAPTVKEAVDQMKHELGKDAVILQSRKVEKEGIFSVSEKPMMEVLAAVDVPEEQIVKKESFTQKKRSSCNLPQEFGRDASPRDVEILKSEVKEIRATVGEIVDYLRYNNLPFLPENLLVVLKQLIDNEVEEKIAKCLVQEIHINLKGDEYNNLKLILKQLLARISAFIRVPKNNNILGKTPYIVSLIGPTGVGKTTTLAKLVANAKLRDHRQVAVISADTYRIAAVEQLKTFANIAGVPFKVVYTPEDMKRAVSQFSDVDQIFIDTTGRSPNDSIHVKEIAAIIEAASPDETHLVLSVTTRYNDLLEVLQKFKIASYNRFLFTKLDETTSLGVILNILTRVRKPIAYLTMGQNVPDDIMSVNPKKLARMIVRRKFL